MCESQLQATNCKIYACVEVDKPVQLETLTKRLQKLYLSSFVPSDVFFQAIHHESLQYHRRNADPLFDLGAKLKDLGTPG